MSTQVKREDAADERERHAGEDAQRVADVAVGEVQEDQDQRAARSGRRSTSVSDARSRCSNWPPNSTRQSLRAKLDPEVLVDLALAPPRRSTRGRARRRCLDDDRRRLPHSRLMTRGPLDPLDLREPRRAGVARRRERTTINVPNRAGVLGDSAPRAAPRAGTAARRRVPRRPRSLPAAATTSSTSCAWRPWRESASESTVDPQDGLARDLLGRRLGRARDRPRGSSRSSSRCPSGSSKSSPKSLTPTSVRTPAIISLMRISIGCVNDDAHAGERPQRRAHRARRAPPASSAFFHRSRGVSVTKTSVTSSPIGSVATSARAGARPDALDLVGELRRGALARSACRCGRLSSADTPGEPDRVDDDRALVEPRDELRAELRARWARSPTTAMQSASRSRAPG